MAEIGPVRIGSRVQIGAGSVVTRDVPYDAIVACVPARLIRSGGAIEAETTEL